MALTRIRFSVLRSLKGNAPYVVGVTKSNRVSDPIMTKDYKTVPDKTDRSYDQSASAFMLSEVFIIAREVITRADGR